MVKNVIKRVKLFTYDVKRLCTVSEGQVTADDIVYKLTEKFAPKSIWELILSYLTKTATVYIGDPVYYTVPFNLLPQIKQTSNLKYSLDVFDCDDFSFLKKGYEEEKGYADGRNYAFGIIWVYSPTKVYGHALNFFIGEDFNLYFYEPQKDSYFSEVIDDWRLITAIV